MGKLTELPTNRVLRALRRAGWEVHGGAKHYKLLNDFERRRHLERQLLELKRHRRQEAVMSWRDLISLKREIRALKREIDSLGRTAGSTPNRDAPT